VCDGRADVTPPVSRRSDASPSRPGRWQRSFPTQTQTQRNAVASPSPSVRPSVRPSRGGARRHGWPAGRRERRGWMGWLTRAAASGAGAGAAQEARRGEARGPLAVSWFPCRFAGSGCGRAALQLGMASVVCWARRRVDSSVQRRLERMLCRSSETTDRWVPLQRHMPHGMHDRPTGNSLCRVHGLLL
jgi:hypothetical protein